MAGENAGGSDWSTSMALSEKMEAALNGQITAELGAAVSYLQMAAFMDWDERPGMASWLYQQSDEELQHARLFMEYLLARDGRVEIGALAAPSSKFDDPVHVFEEALRQERRVTSLIRSLYRLAVAEDDLESLPILQRFLDEQVEEEDALNGICERLGRVRGNEVGLALIESELASRDGGEE